MRLRMASSVSRHELICFSFVLLGLLTLERQMELFLTFGTVLDSQSETIAEAGTAILIVEDKTDWMREGFATTETDGRTANGTRIHITHVFNSFLPKPGSSMEREMILVQNSWKAAAAYAHEQAGLVVEYVDAILPLDGKSVPEFAREVHLSGYIFDPIGKRKLPPVGEVFEKGKERGKGEWLIYTNADIGVLLDFYVKIWELISTDYTSVEFQSFVLHETMKYLSYCMANHGTQIPLRNDVCRAGARTYYEHQGGILSVYTEDKMIRDLVHLYLLEVIRSENAFISSKATWVGMCMELGAARCEEMLSDWNKFTSWEFQGYEIPSKERYNMAFTVTRLDLDVDIWRYSPDANGLSQLYQVTKTPKAYPHPGNDCFVMPRPFLPKMVANLGHPLGWRPWGMWIPYAFRWEKGMHWRRFTSTQRNAYTFHVGVSGLVAENWKRFAHQEPHFLIFHVANWNEISGGRFGQQYQVPKYCQDVRLLRSVKFCSKAPPSYCQGAVRLGCEGYQNPQARDPKFYASLCELLVGNVQRKKSTGIKEPLCKYCKTLLGIIPPSSSFDVETMVKCIPGRVRECQHMKCVYYENGTDQSQQLWTP